MGRAMTIEILLVFIFAGILFASAFIRDLLPE